MTRDLTGPEFAALAIALPLTALMLHHGFGHDGDQRFFFDWYQAFGEGAAFYRDGPGVNYPILGALVVCLPARGVELISGPLDFEAYRWVLKTTLAIGEMLTIAAMASLARTLEIPRHRAVAIGLALLPSFWAPGALFGQIDVWGTGALLASCSALLCYRRSGSLRALLAGLLMFHAAILLKQLVVFTLPALAIVLGVGLLRHRKASHVVMALMSPLLLIVADPWLVLPDGYTSHLAWVVLGGGSAHADFIVAGGASLWSLIGDINTSAHDWHMLGVTAFAWGVVFYIGAMVWALGRMTRGAKPNMLSVRDSSLVTFAGISNLAMATLLTGVHERYLVHGAPFLILGLATLPRLRLAAIIVVSWWGLFVLASVSFDAFVGPLVIFRMHQPIAMLLLILLATLLYPRRAA